MRVVLSPRWNYMYKALSKFSAHWIYKQCLLLSPFLSLLLLLSKVMELFTARVRMQSWATSIPVMRTSLTSFLLFPQNGRAHPHSPISLHLEKSLPSKWMIKYRFLFLNMNWVALTYLFEKYIGNPSPVLWSVDLVKCFSIQLFNVISKNTFYKAK